MKPAEEILPIAEKLAEGMQHLFDMRRKKGSASAKMNAWNICATRLWDFNKAIQEAMTQEQQREVGRADYWNVDTQEEQDAIEDFYNPKPTGDCLHKIRKILCILVPLKASLKLLLRKRKLKNAGEIF